MLLDINSRIIETPVLDYAMQQYRLFAVVVQAYVVFFTGEFITNNTMCKVQAWIYYVLSRSFTNPTWEDSIDEKRRSLHYSPSLKKVLTSVCNLFALHTIEKEPSESLKQKYLSSKQARMLKIQVSELIKKVRPNAVVLVDAFNLPDYLLKSALG
ncbi:4926_t:CDS:2, partial [Racocetra fulgida]